MDSFTKRWRSLDSVISSSSSRLALSGASPSGPDSGVGMPSSSSSLHADVSLKLSGAMCNEDLVQVLCSRLPSMMAWTRGA